MCKLATPGIERADLVRRERIGAGADFRMTRKRERCVRNRAETGCTCNARARRRDSISVSSFGTLPRDTSSITPRFGKHRAIADRQRGPDPALVLRDLDEGLDAVKKPGIVARAHADAVAVNRDLIFLRSERRASPWSMRWSPVHSRREYANRSIRGLRRPVLRRNAPRLIVAGE